jgi:hypothetical protein
MSIDAHFQSLATLEPGSRVARRTKGAVQQGVLIEIRRDQLGEPSLILEMGKGAKAWRETVPKPLCTQITAVPDNQIQYAGRRRRLTAPPIFESVCPAVDFAGFATSARLDCVVVGSARQFEAEVTTPEFAAERDPGVACGSLNEVLRLKRLSSASTFYRSDLIPARSELPTGLKDDLRRPVVVLDGAAALTRWGDYWQQSPTVVILDKSQHSSIDTALEVDYSYSTRYSDSDLLATVDLPESLEALAWTEAE